ncbi:MAG: polysaccharide deacetylase family protein [Deltaproteobacteria bacterium HGW-Deltaproteobacteria-2]|jgi:peptidoglycan/xylan/chitin deacetylase (PgdA/CDA1 family)|nr:MAG: polysaccharide deacetylase family protein [Deltaproteobacteria bacterium HGW-Deltaproteobacteria-2]
MKKKLSSLSPAQITGIVFLFVAAAAFFVDSLLAIIIALLYILLCVVASFCYRSSFYLPVISRGNTGQNLVALTFDDGPAEPTTKQILELLDKYSVKATFFVSGVNALKHPELITEIINRGHTIGNHSFHHNPFLMLGRYNYLYQEVSRAQEVLKDMGVNAPAFRPPVGIISPKLPSVLNKLGMFCVTFNCRAYDAGNRCVNNLSLRILKKVKADDIILLHDANPRGKEDSAVLISEIEKILRGLIVKDLKGVPLSALIGREIN